MCDTEFDAQLMEVDSSQKRDALKILIASLTQPQKHYWIGMIQSSGDINGEEYSWLSSATPLHPDNFTSWRPYMPYDYKRKCVRAYSDINSGHNYWMNYPCSDIFPFVCEFDKGKI